MAGRLRAGCPPGRTRPSRTPSAFRTMKRDRGVTAASFAARSEMHSPRSARISRRRSRPRSVATASRWRRSLDPTIRITRPRSSSVEIRRLIAEGETCSTAASRPILIGPARATTESAATSSGPRSSHSRSRRCRRIRCTATLSSRPVASNTSFPGRGRRCERRSPSFHHRRVIPPSPRDDVSSFSNLWRSRRLARFICMMQTTDGPADGWSGRGLHAPRPARRPMHLFDSCKQRRRKQATPSDCASEAS